MVTTTAELQQRRAQGMLAPRPKADVRVVASGFGAVLRSGQKLPKVRAWLIEAGGGEDGSVDRELALYRNDPQTGQAMRQSLGQVSHAVIRPARWDVTLESGEPVTLLIASCTCGGGQAAYAGPVNFRHAVTMVRAPEWVD